MTSRKEISKSALKMTLDVCIPIGTIIISIHPTILSCKRHTTLAFCKALRTLTNRIPSDILDMCYKVNCKSCGKATWMGCGLHVDDALRGIKEDDLCTNWKKGCRYPCGVLPTSARKTEVVSICSRTRKPKTSSGRSVTSSSRSNRSSSERSLDTLKSQDSATLSECVEVGLALEKTPEDDQHSHPVVDPEQTVSGM